MSSLVPNRTAVTCPLRDVGGAELALGGATVAGAFEVPPPLESKPASAEKGFDHVGCAGAEAVGAALGAIVTSAWSGAVP